MPFFSVKYRNNNNHDVKLDYLRSYVSSAAQAVLAKGNSVPGLPRFNLGERRHEYDGHSIWTLYDGKEVRRSLKEGCYTSGILMRTYSLFCPAVLRIPRHAPFTYAIHATS